MSLSRRQRFPNLNSGHVGSVSFLVFHLNSFFLVLRDDIFNYKHDFWFSRGSYISNGGARQLGRQEYFCVNLGVAKYPRYQWSHPTILII